MSELARAILDEPELRRVAAAVDAGGLPGVVSGLSAISRTKMLAAIHETTGRPVVLVVSDEIELRRMTGDLETLTGKSVCAIIPRDFVLREVDTVSREYERQKLGALVRAETAEVFVATAWGLMQRVIPRKLLHAATFELTPGEVHDIDELCKRLVEAGYVRAEQLDGTGQFARRGGILDIFSPLYDEPVRVEFYGDEIDMMAFFDVSTQRRGEPCDSVVVIPAAETLPQLAEGGIPVLIEKLEALSANAKGARAAAQRSQIATDIERLKNGSGFAALDKYMELCYGFEAVVNYLPEDAVVLISEPQRVKETAIRAEKQMADDCVPLLESGALESSLIRFNETTDGLFLRLERFPVIMADAFTTSQYPLQPRLLANVLTKQLPSYGGSLETAAGDISHYSASGYSTVITVSSKASGNALSQYLSERGIHAALDFELRNIPKAGEVSITVGALSSGVEYPGIKLAVLTEGQFFGSRKPSRAKKARKKTNRERIQSFTDLTNGDLVVHEHHGIGRFAGVFQMPVDNVKKDYIKIQYAGGDSLYIPVTQLDLVSKYIGGGEDSGAKLSKMGGAEWAKAKSRARASAKNMAHELTQLYAERQRIRGHAFGEDSIWQTEFEEKFGYAETDDQVRCVEEIKSDMTRAVPMDRLLCGDVGYGKTEVALRAVMKCVLGGRQAAILVPTTVLARQHYITTLQRFAGYPVNIEVLSRFRSPNDIKIALRNIRLGTADIVIGTHRLLQKDVEFQKLGLVVVDEEQRFGVSHKERLKEITKHVDVLTLSATPIPRTLNMALSGIRDMSLIEEPPTGRQPVQTYVMEHNWEMLADAMRREIARGGQVYYLHNRIETIDRTASRLSRLLNGGYDAGSSVEESRSDSVYGNHDKVVVAVGHGQMDEESLSDVMERLSDGEISVLVCTTIIETGIDIPNVNTLIIEDADKMGLSQLHQIRGRVGRSPRRAFAYLTFRHGKVLSEIATKRLGAIREFAEFNSGFKIAMRDLEIRGAGNLLGAEQSGHMMKVGYDMYLKLLEEAVLEERGEKPKQKAECAADITVSAILPESYVPSGTQRVDLYRRIARVRTEEDADEMIAELIDRYGDPPPEAVALVRVAQLRAEAAGCGVAEITQKSGRLRLRLAEFDMSIISALYSMPEFTGRVRVEAGSEPAVLLTLKTKDVLGEAERFVRAWHGLDGVTA